VKRSLIIVISSILLLAGVGATLFLRAPSLHSIARREWKQKSIAEISTFIANSAWSSNEIALMKTRSGDESWLSDHMIRMSNGDWLAYANSCQKQDGRIPDIFLARGSDGHWYYSTYHFCIGMVVLRMDEQPADLAGFTKTYFLRTFDGHSDDCLEKTWPPSPR
jgi:hypothetical protein